MIESPIFPFKEGMLSSIMKILFILDREPRIPQWCIFLLFEDICAGIESIQVNECVPLTIFLEESSNEVRIPMIQATTESAPDQVFKSKFGSFLLLIYVWSKSSLTEGK